MCGFLAKKLIAQTHSLEKFPYLCISRRIRDAVFDGFCVVNILMVRELFYKLSRLKRRENTVSMRRYLLQRIMITDNEIEVDIVLPLCPPSHRIRLHGSQGKERWDFYHSFDIFGRFYIKWKVKKGDLYIVYHSHVLSLFVDMEDLPLCPTGIEDGLDDISLKIFPPKKIEIDAFTMAKMEGNGCATNHIETPFPGFAQEIKKLYLFGRKNLDMHIIWQGNETNMRASEVLNFVHDDS